MSLIKKIHDHGYMRYSYGCRCDICKTANAEYSREYRNNKLKGIPTVRKLKEYDHGMRGKYQNGCRCAECKKASAKYHRELVARNKQKGKVRIHKKKLLQSSDLFDSIK